MSPKNYQTAQTSDRTPLLPDPDLARKALEIRSYRLGDPLAIDLPGLLGHPLSDLEALEFVAQSIYKHRLEILSAIDKIAHTHAGKVELLQSLVVAEALLDRSGYDTELEGGIRPTTVQAASFRALAETPARKSRS